MCRVHVHAIYHLELGRTSIHLTSRAVVRIGDTETDHPVKVNNDLHSVHRLIYKRTCPIVASQTARVVK